MYSCGDVASMDRLQFSEVRVFQREMRAISLSIKWAVGTNDLKASGGSDKLGFW